MRIIGLDIHRTFAEVMFLENGELVHGGRVQLTHRTFSAFTKQGRALARAMLVEAAWAAAKTPGPLRAFFVRVRARRGHQIAAVATARKMAAMIWHMLTKKEDYAWCRPALNARKIRDLELKAGFPSERGNRRGKACDYSLRHVREEERRFIERAEKACQRLVKGWRPEGPRRRKKEGCTDATQERAS